MRDLQADVRHRGKLRRYYFEYPIELGFSTQQSIMDILDEYRDKLLKTDYDMI